MLDPDRYFKLHPPPETPADEKCVCEPGKPIKLMPALGFNPLHCIDCNLEVAPESFALSDSLIEHIASWRSVHEAVNCLWLDSREYETWAAEQLADINSPINRRGMALRKELDAVRRCYYWYFQDESVDSFKPVSRCPSCQEPLSVYDEGIFQQLVCEGCGLVMAGE